MLRQPDHQAIAQRVRPDSAGLPRLDCLAANNSTYCLGGSGWTLWGFSRTLGRIVSTAQKRRIQIPQVGDPPRLWSGRDGALWGGRSEVWLPLNFGIIGENFGRMAKPEVPRGSRTARALEGRT